MRPTTRIAAVMAALLAPLPLYGWGSAQSQQPPANTQQRIEQVIVAARRRSERVESVPMAITALSGKQIEQNRIVQIEDLAKYVPSLSYYGFGSDANGYSANQVRLRGLFGSVIYFADVPVDSVDENPTTSISHGSSPGLFYDLANVQVLKGPQGTLFGRNSIGGLIDIEPKQPTEKYEGYFTGALGNYNDRQFEGAVNIPVLDDKLLIRIAGQMQERDGYTKDISNGKDYDDRNFYATRVGLTFRPSENFEDYFLYDGYYQHSNGSAVIPAYVNPGFVFARIPLGAADSVPLTLGNGPNVAGLSSSNPLPTIEAALKAGSLSLFPNINAILAEQQALGVRAVTGRATPGLGKDYFFGFTNTSKWTLDGDLVLKNIAAARLYQQLTSVDYFGGAIPLLAIGDSTNNTGWNEDSIHYTEEPQLQGTAINGRLQWITGAFFELDQPLSYTNQPDLQVDTARFFHFYDSSRSEAGFVHGTYDLSQYVSGLQFSAGYRYTWDYVSVREFGFKNVPVVEVGSDGRPVNCAPIGYITGDCLSRFAAHYSAPGWNLSLDDQISPNWLVYVRSGSAYRPGYSNPQAPVGFQSVRPERVTDVEIGSKLDWQIAGRPVRVDIDAFHTFYNAVQISQAVSVPNQTDPGGPPSVAEVATNDGGAELSGAEITMTFSPLPGLSISPQGSYLHAAYTKYPSGTPEPLFEYLPSWQGGVSGDYRYIFDGSAGTMVFAANYSYLSRQYIAPKGSDVVSSISGHDNLNLNVRWEGVFGRPLDMTLFMTNVLNRVYVQSAAPLYNVVGFTSLVYNEPRMFGLSLTYHFG